MVDSLFLRLRSIFRRPQRLIMTRHLFSPFNPGFLHSNICLISKKSQLVLCCIVNKQHIALGYMLAFVHRYTLYQCVSQLHIHHTAGRHIAGVLCVVSPVGIVDHADRIDFHFFIFVQDPHQNQSGRNGHYNGCNNNDKTDPFFLSHRNLLCSLIVSSVAPSVMRPSRIRIFRFPNSAISGSCVIMMMVMPSLFSSVKSSMI